MIREFMKLDGFCDHHVLPSLMSRGLQRSTIMHLRNLSKWHLLHHHHPRIHRQRRRHPHTGFALPANLCRHHVLLQLHAHPDCAWHADAHCHLQRHCCTAISGASARAIPTRRAQPSLGLSLKLEQRAPFEALIRRLRGF